MGEKLTKKLIKSQIPNKFFDGSKLNGVSLTKNSYDLFCDKKYKSYILRTTIDNPLIDILQKKFEVTYIRHWWLHYSEFIIKNKK